MFGGTCTHEKRFVSGDVQVHLTGIDARDHIDALRDATALVCRAEAARIDVVASALAANAHCEDGHRNTAAWIRSTVDVTKASSFQWERRGRLANDHPEYLDALRHGDLHLDHFDEIVRAHSNPRCRELLGEFVDEFVTTAQMVTFADFVRVIDLWIRLADADGDEPADAPLDRRCFRIRKKRDGSSDLHGHLDPTATAVFEDIFNRFLDTESSIDHAAARDAGIPGELPRSLPQRRADALMAMVAQSVQAPPGQTAKPLCTIVVDWQTALQTIEGWDPDDPTPMRHRMCRTADGQSLAPDAVLEAMLVGRVQVLILDALRHPVAAGRAGSLFTAEQRRMLQALNPECTWSGCPTPSRHLEADHVQPRSRGGPTTMVNAAATCGHHNRWRHDHGYHLHRDALGIWHTTRPDGTTLD